MWWRGTAGDYNNLWLQLAFQDSAGRNLCALLAAKENTALTWIDFIELLKNCLSILGIIHPARDEDVNTYEIRSYALPGHKLTGDEALPRSLTEQQHAAFYEEKKWSLAADLWALQGAGLAGHQCCCPDGTICREWRHASISCSMRAYRAMRAFHVPCEHIMVAWRHSRNFLTPPLNSYSSF